VCRLAHNEVQPKIESKHMKLVQTVIREIAQSESDVTADDIVNTIIEKMCASGSTQEACDDIRERLIGITICALDVMTNPDLVTEWTESAWDTPAQEPAPKVLH
jgi:hypothetical protein